MSDQIDRETTTKNVTSNPNTSVNGYSTSERSTTRASNDDNLGGLILGVLLALAVGAGAVLYYLNNRPSPTQILVPGASNTLRDNKSTVIERNNTTTKEVTPAPTQSAPNVEVNVPAPAATTPPQTATPAPTASPAPGSTN